MRVTPLDIRKQEFRKTMRGLDSDEVYAFLNTVADEYEAVLSDNKKLREHIVELEERLKEYKRIETNLRNTLLTAEKLTAEAKENARREAGLILREAEVDAEKAAETIRAHTMQLRREILELKKQKDNYLTRLKTLLDSHRRVLEGFEEDFSQVDREIEIIGRKVDEDTKKAVSTPRMSREKITEEFSGETHDKVTWGDEKKKEDEGRPSVPRPDWHGKVPERGASPPEDSIESTSTSDAQTDEVTGTDEVEVPHIETEPIGAVDEVRKPVEDVSLPGASDGTGERVDEEAADDDSTEGEARRIVEQSIEEKLYPEMNVSEKGAERQQASPGSDASEHTAGSQTSPYGAMEVTAQPGYGAAEQAVMQEDSDSPHASASTAMQSEQHAGEPWMDAASVTDASKAGEPRMDVAPESAHAEDDWKKYEVRDEEPDWSNYEIPIDGKTQKDDKVTPSENEVEAALSGLKEMMGVKGDQVERKGPEPAMKPGESTDVKEDKSTGAGGLSESKEEQKDARNEAVEDEQADSDEPLQAEGAEDDSQSTWSMEQLRKNLSSFGQDEE